MISDSLTIRGAMFAYLFGPGRIIERDEASDIHGAICDALGHDEMVFQYNPIPNPASPAMKGFRINMLLQDERGRYEVIMDFSGMPNNPIRLLMSYEWPPSMQYAKEQFDLTAQAVFETMDGSSMKVSAEARMRGQVSVRGNDALMYIQNNLMNFDRGWLEKFGRPMSFASVKLGSESAYDGNPLESPRRELNIEILREDPRSLYLELVSQWPQFSYTAKQSGMFEADSIRPIKDKPGEYLEEAYNFLKKRIADLED